MVRGRTPRLARATELIGRDTTESLDIGLIDAHRVRERGRLAAQKSLVRALHAQRKQLAMDDYFTFAATRTDELEDTDEFSSVRFHVTALVCCTNPNWFVLIAISVSCSQVSTRGP
ncbi:MAG TPA: hypothetical protein VID48_12340 [Solirubrobacteraceae bacterium]